jgi:hypothetical protein
MMSDALKMELLKELMFGKDVWDHEHHEEIMYLYDFGYVKLYDDNMQFAATTEQGIEELSRLIKLYFVFLN